MGEFDDMKMPDGRTHGQWVMQSRAEQRRAEDQRIREALAERQQREPLPPSRPPVFGADWMMMEWRRAVRHAANTSPYRYSVSPSCSVHTRRGLLRAGERIEPKDVDGMHQLDVLISSGVVAENTSAERDGGPDDAA